MIASGQGLGRTNEFRAWQSLGARLRSARREKPAPKAAIPLHSIDPRNHFFRNRLFSGFFLFRSGTSATRKMRKNAPAGASALRHRRQTRPAGDAAEETGRQAVAGEQL